MIHYLKKNLIVLFCCIGLMFSQSGQVIALAELPVDFTRETKACLKCHEKESRGITQQWGGSKHYRARVGCYECHQSKVGDPGSFMHHKARISIIVSPNDCSKCHEKESNEFQSSHHSQAARILGSLDNILAEVIEGNRGFKSEAFPNGVSAAAVNGCWQCHGSDVKVLKDGRLDPTTWPNTGIGRINPDGSRGSCTACHSRHKFSVAQARRPENCGKCHMGPDHPQIEIYNESKHGIAFYANVDKMNLDNEKWIVGVDYNAAPTCATCHMSATKKQGVTHDVGLRISWNNRPVKSIRPEVSDAKMNLPGAEINWETRRNNMKDVCLTCHNTEYINNFYIQYDELIKLYHEKFADPGIKIMKAAQPLLKPFTFSNKIDWIWFEIWHHEGRRARHAASMNAPDYTHWHGTYEVARNWYSKFIPEIEKIISQNKGSQDPDKARAVIALEKALTDTLNDENHKWYIGKMSDSEKKARKEQAASFTARYTK